MAAEQRNLAHATEMPQAHNLPKLIFSKRRDFRQKERKRRHKAANAKAFQCRPGITNHIFITSCKRFKPAQKHLRRHRLIFKRKRQNFIVKVACKFHRLVVILFQKRTFFRSPRIRFPAIIDNFRSRLRMHQTTLAQHIKHRTHLAIFKLRHRHEHRAHSKRFFNVNERLVQRIIGIIELVYEQNRTHTRFA